MHPLLVLSLVATIVSQGDRRIVDRVIVGDTASEVSHAYAGDGVTTGSADGQAFRQARGWMRYALTVFDDTEVTVAATFLGSAGTTGAFDVIVENHVVTTCTFRSTEKTTVEFRVPLSVTYGKTSIIVVLRAADGSTPRLVELRSVQDHNE